MNTQLLKQTWLVSLVFFMNVIVFAQGLPPGWDYTPTPTTHIVSLPLDCEPNINGWPINPGDWIGAFYVDDEGELACGGAVEWDGFENTGLIAFGDDSFTPEKDGFDSGETINYKVYSWSLEKAYDADVTCNDALPSPCDVFTANGLSGVAVFDATGFYIVVTAEPNEICLGDDAQLNSNASGGSGTYTFIWSSDPAGFTSNIANPVVSPTQNTVFTVQVTDSDETLINSVSVFVFPGPEVSAGSDIVICEDDIASVSGDATNFQSVFWTSSGDGLFTDPASLQTEYSPGTGDIAAGFITLTLTAQPLEPCTVSVSSDLQLDIIGLPMLNAGENSTICENTEVNLAPSVSNYSSLLWTTSGDGTFSDPSIPNAVYTPGPGDISSGEVNLEIEINPIVPCTGSLIDDLSISIVTLPEVNAGNNIAVCEDGMAELNGEVNNYQSVLWVSNGDGSFGDPNLLQTTYTPGPEDILAGSATLSLIAQPLAPCVDVISDNLILTIVMLPTANAGNDATVCEDNSHQLNASAAQYEEVIWSSSGNGTFGDPNALNTFYTPGSDDILAGEAMLTLTALPEFPCSVNAEDIMLLTVMALPNLDAGEDDSVCQDEDFQLNATAENFNSIIWSTAGDGIFADPTSLTTSYAPGDNDVLIGNVELTLEATPMFPCVTIIQDQLNLSVISLPEVLAGDDATICEDNTHQLNGQATNFLIIQWITSGDGSFSNISVFDPVYTPGPGDIFDGSVELSLTAVPISPCTDMQQSDLTLTITGLPAADAGPDAVVPEGQVHQLEGLAENYSSILWTTSGDGDFSDTGILAPFYTPGEQDITNTEVILTLTAEAISPCILAAMDDMILEVDTMVGIRPPNKIMSLNAFPNPTNGQVQIQIPTKGNKNYGILKIFSLSGELLVDNFLIGEAVNQEQRVLLDISDYPNGIYLIQVLADGQIWQSKVILRKE